MEIRSNAKEALPEGLRALCPLHGFIHRCGLDQNLLELVKLRTSQINGCAHCIDMLAKELRASGET